MKKTAILLMALVLTVSVMTGCGCRNSTPATTTVPTTMPAMTTMPTTQATTAPTTASTEPSLDPTIPDGNGPVSTDGTEGENANAKSRSNGMVGGSSTPGSTGTGNGITGSIG